MTTTNQAACVGLETSIFFPAEGEPAQTDTAVKVCQGCEVQVQCLTTALQYREEFGIWGGTVPAERKYIRRHRITPKEYLSVRCGTLEGYYRHRRVQTAVCQSCKDAFKIDQINRGSGKRKSK